MAPEMQSQGNFEYNKLVDEYSLGATLYETMVGSKLVRDPDNETELKNPVQRWERMRIRMKEYDALVSKLLKRDPTKRWEAAEFLRRVEALK